MAAESDAGIDLYWLPLGAGGHSVRWNGRVFEAVVARLEARPPRDLYHAALEVRVRAGRFVVEQVPAWGGDREGRGVVADGAVGSSLAGRLRLFRYEVRCSCGGVIPDMGEAVDSPRRLTGDHVVAERLLELVPQAPTPVWGRDELGVGEMWNSNSLIAWLLSSCGLPAETVAPPAGGRAPGWNAGIAVARRDAGRASPREPGDEEPRLRRSRRGAG